VLQIWDVYPGSRILNFYPYRIPDPKTHQKRGVKKVGCHTFFVASNFTKLKIILFYEMLGKKNLAQFSKNYKTFYPKIFHQAQKIWVLEPIRIFNCRVSKMHKIRRVHVS
jgi:hypothetical protein